MITVIYENNTAAVIVRNEVSSWNCVQSRTKQDCVLYPFIWVILIDFALRSPCKTMLEYEIKLGSISFLDLHYPDDSRILDESVSKMNELLVILNSDSDFELLSFRE